MRVSAAPNRSLKVLLLIGSTTCLVACGTDDRVLMAQCYARDGVLFATSVPAVEDTSTSSHKAKKMILGTIFQRVPGNNESSDHQFKILYRPASPPHSESRALSWFDDAGAAQLRFSVDATTNPLDKRLRDQLDSRIASSIQVFYGDAQQETIRDLLRTVTEDPHALNTLRRSGDQKRIFVVSSILSARSLGFFLDTTEHNSIPFVGVNTLRLGSTYFHVDLSCPPIDASASRAKAAAERAPMLYLYKAIWYDGSTRRVHINPLTVYQETPDSESQSKKE